MHLLSANFECCLIMSIHSEDLVFVQAVPIKAHFLYYVTNFVLHAMKHNITYLLFTTTYLITY